VKNGQERTFIQIWCQGRPWLKYNKEKNVMTCKLCTELAETKQSSNNLKHKHLFISGCNNLRISTVNDHEKSKGHLDALQVKHAKDQPEQTEGHKTLGKLNEQIQKQVINKVTSYGLMTWTRQKDLIMDKFIIINQQLHNAWKALPM
jgi:hypothetical protein